jgi:hypothetical protein
VLSENCPAERFDFAEGNCPHTSSLEPETKSTDAAEEVKDIH